MRRLAGIALVLLGFPLGAWAEGSAVTRYLVDGRVHVAVIARADRSGGALSWLDTVSGRGGDTPFSTHGAVLRLATSARPARAFLVGDFALVVESPPWDPGRPTALGLSVN